MYGIASVVGVSQLRVIGFYWLLHLYFNFSAQGQLTGAGAVCSGTITSTFCSHDSAAPEFRGAHVSSTVYNMCMGLVAWVLIIRV